MLTIASVLSACGSGPSGLVIKFYTPATDAATFTEVARRCNEQFGGRFTVRAREPAEVSGRAARAVCPSAHR